MPLGHTTDLSASQHNIGQSVPFNQGGGEVVEDDQLKSIYTI